MKAKEKGAATNMSDLGPPKRKRGRPAKTDIRPKPETRKKAKKDTIELDNDTDTEEECPIKWRDNEIETLIAIRGEMEEEFAKSARKQGKKFLTLI